MKQDERCYLCAWANRLVEHPERKDRKFFIKCKLDHVEHAPCYSCEDFMNRIRRESNGGTYPLEENY